MALTSFTLRKTSNGSQLRSSSAVDSSLRADGVSSGDVIASLTTGESTFSANIISPGTVRLSWTLSEPLEYGTGSEIVPRELHIVSSYSGEPVTVKDGIVVSVVDPDTLSTFIDDAPNVSEGRWVYYALFVRYVDTTTNDFWFVRAATLYIQIPISYNSVDSLWKKIPEYYRALDYDQPSLASGYKPLYGFLELFGNELDRTRTLIESVSLSNDPELAVTPALEQLAYETGLEININDLGTSKVRSLMNNIGTLRQRKGTIGSISSYISAMTGCRVEYIYAAPPNPTPHNFYVHAQRINFISDPEFANVTTTTNSGVASDFSNSYYTVLTSTSTWGVYIYGSDSTGASNPAVSVANNQLTITTPPGSYGTRTVFVYPQRPFPYYGINKYGTSYEYSNTVGASSNGVRIMTYEKKNQIQATGTTVFHAPFFADNATYTEPEVAFSSVSERPSYEYSPTTTSASVSFNAIPVLIFNMDPGSEINISEWLFEPSANGDYFSGNTRYGGYIPISTGGAGQGTFDYYWDTTQGGANDSFSYYLLDHERTIKTTERVIQQYIVPVTMLDKYQIIWDYYPPIYGP